MTQDHHHCGRRWLRGRAVVLQPGRQFDPSLPHLQAEVSLGKRLNPEWPLIEKQVLLTDALYERVCEQVKGKLCCAAL